MVASDPMLEVRGVNEAVRARAGPRSRFLRNPSRRYPRYIGPNGAGKTTTIKAIVGLLSRFDGEVVLEGRPIRALG